MENQNLVEPKKSLYSLSNVLVFLLFVIVVVYFVFAYKKANFVPTLEQSKSALLKGSTFSIDQAGEFENIEVSALPKEFQSLLSFNPENVLIRKGNNGNGKVSYKVTFTANTPLFSYYQTTRTLLSKNKEWDVTYATRSTAFSVIEAQSIFYGLQIQVSYLSADSSDVLISIQQK